MKRESEAPVKKPYQAPKLIVYGDLTQLTIDRGDDGGTVRQYDADQAYLIRPFKQR